MCPGCAGAPLPIGADRVVPIEQTEPHASNGKSVVSIKQVQPEVTVRMAQHVLMHADIKPNRRKCNVLTVNHCKNGPRTGIFLCIW